MLVRIASAAGLFLIASLVACAPPTLPAGADQSAETSGNNDDSSSSKKSSTSGDDDDDDTGSNANTSSTTSTPASGTSTGTTNTASVPPTFDTLYKSMANCEGCHAPGGSGPALFGADEPSSYTQFKTEGFNKTGGLALPASGHPVQALSDDQQNALNAWIAADPATN